MSFNPLDRFRASKNFFELNLKYLFLVGLWPEENWTRNQLFLYKIYQNTLHCFSIIFLVISGIKTYQIRDDMILFLSNVDKSIICYNYFGKVIFFLIRRKTLKGLVDDMFFCGDKVSEKSRKEMINHVVVITVYNTGLMAIFSLLTLSNGDMPVEAWMPFDERKNRMNLALSAQIIIVLFCVPFSYRAIGMQGMICSILIYLCDQLETLQAAIQDLRYSKENETEFRKIFNTILMKHIRLMRYAKSMETIFKEYFLIQNLAVTMELCLNAMIISVVGTEQKIMLTSFLGMLGLTLLNAYIYCKLGNKLIDQSEGLAFAAYSSSWTTWPIDMQKNILLITMASQRPFQLSAGGIAVISMQTYGTAIYNGYSIFAVLNDMVVK